MDRSVGHIPFFVLAMVLAMGTPMFSVKDAPKRPLAHYRRGNTNVRRSSRVNRPPIRLDNRRHPNYRDRKLAA